MPLNYGSTYYGGSVPSFSGAEAAEHYWHWNVKWYHKSGGLKKDWYIGQDTCPITGLKYEKPLKLMGAGTLNLAYVDFPIDSDDYIIVSFDGKRDYTAIVENYCDPKGEDDIKLVPYSIRFEELLYTGTFVAQTLATIFQTIVQAVQTDSNISWISAKIATALLNDVTTYSFDYSEGEYCADIFDELIKKVTNLYWGVNAYNQFEIYAMETTLSDYYYYNSSPVFTEIKIKKEFTGFGDTRGTAYHKNAAGETENAGQVGYGGGYPALGIESYIRKKEGKKIYQIDMTNTEAKDLYYAELTSKRIPQSIEISNVSLDEKTPYVRQYIQAEDRLEKILYTVIDCNSTARWYNATQDTTDCVEKDFVNNTGGSLYMASALAYTSMIYDFGYFYRPFHCEKIGFMVKSSYAGSFLECSIGRAHAGAWGSGLWMRGLWMKGLAAGLTDLWDTCYSIDIPTGNVWKFFEVDITSDPSITNGFRFFGIRFKSTPPASTTVKIDRIQLYMYHKTQISQNIVMIKTNIKKGGYYCDLVLDSYDIQANKQAFDLQRRIEIMEAVSEQ